MKKLLTVLAILSLLALPAAAGASGYDVYRPAADRALAARNMVRMGVDGLRRALEQNGPTPNDISNAMKAEIVNEANTGMQWINDENITAEHLIGMTKSEAYAEYQAWCEKNGYAKTAMGSGTLSALFGTYFRLKCSKTDHREFSTGRKSVKVYERKVP